MSWAMKAGLRIIADDLTGALDSSAAFTTRREHISVLWKDWADIELAHHVGIDLGTREAGPEEAVRAATNAARLLRGSSLAYLKVDSLLRGHGMRELVACLGGGEFSHCVVAPAFPHHGRVTLSGVQLRKERDAVVPVADLTALLREVGITSRCATAGECPAAGVTVFDAATDADLDKIVEAHDQLDSSILWCGSAGLATALARTRAPILCRPSAVWLQGRVLGLFGSDQPQTRAQLAACSARWLEISDGESESATRVEQMMEQLGAALVSVALPGGATRQEARLRISATLDRLVARLPQPGTLLVAGGETLRTLCDGLGATRLDVVGEIEPGLPVSFMRGGLWDGLQVVSKSGAFGAPGLWRDLITTHLHPEGIS